MSVARGSFQPALLARLSQAAARAWSVSQLREANNNDLDDLPPALPCCDFVRPKYHVHPCLRGVLKNHIARKEDEIKALEEAMRSFGMYSPKSKAQSVIFMKIFQSRRELSSLIDDLDECEANALLERELRAAEETVLQTSETNEG